MDLSGGIRKPVIFTAVRKRPFGLSPRQTAPLQKYQIVEKMLEPWTSTLIDLLSLAYGTPPQIKRFQYDVPDPTLEFLTSKDASDAQNGAASVFIALVTLTGVLDKYLEFVYDLNQDSDQDNGQTSLGLELSLGQWEDSLSDDVRRIITRGNNLHIPGAANLRLAYLSTKLLRRRIELDIEKQEDAALGDALTNRYIQVRRAAEEIVLLVQELEEIHLSDFWLPVSAFAFTSAITFLLRCALETENTAAGLAQSASLRLANNLIDSLQSHQQKSGWDLGDLCLAQYAEVVEKLMTADSPSATVPEFQQLMMSSEVPIIDELFPNLWDMF
ncbi:putative transcriptional regulatory protein [Colletotrichum sp. SAR11_240]|nr:putative transcriptional regulatory protein [Colletotrichum sp. SAR11_240]